jgi:hypothetical protein
MSGALTAQQSFQEKIGDRLRSDIGDLIPDDALAEMVNKAINDMFFTPKEGNPGGYHSAKLPSWFQDEVEKVLHSEMQKHIKKWVHANEYEIESAVKESMTSASGDILAKLVTNAIANAGMSIGDQVGFSIGDVIQRRMQNL